MAPKETFENHIIPSGILSETEVETDDGGLVKPAGQVAENRKFIIVWRNVIIMSALHVFFLGGLLMLLTGRTKWQTNVLGNIEI
jgi:hypothetical protein